MEALRTELQSQKPSAARLGKRAAAAAGVSGDEIEEAEDAEDPKAALIALILDAQPGPGSASEDMSALRSELQAMRVKALERRAVSEGVSAEAVEDAMDGENPKGLLIDLIADVAASRGPADRLLSALTTGGQSAADTLSAALDQALDQPLGRFMAAMPSIVQRSLAFEQI